MGKTAKIKSDLDDVTAMVEIFQVLKQVASNMFFSTAKQKAKFVEFAQAFTDFFKMVSLTKASSPLVKNNVDKVLYVLITGECGFMAQMTSKIIKQGIMKAGPSGSSTFIVTGTKGCDKMKLAGRDFIPINDVEEKGYYKAALEIKELVVDMVMKKKVGKAFCVYPRALSLEAIKPYTVKLLPSGELLSKQENIKDVVEKVILESSIDDIIHYLSDVWLTCRLYEMLLDCRVAGFAAQSQQLEEGLDKLQGDKKQLASAFRKSQKGDIDSSMREIFTAKTIISG